MNRRFLKTEGMQTLDISSEEDCFFGDLGVSVSILRCTVIGLPVTVVLGRMNHVEGLTRPALRALQSQVVRRILLRTVLQDYPEFPADAWQISDGRKQCPPVLSGPVPLQVSFSHRGVWLAVAFSASCAAVGVDLEPSPKILKPEAWDLFLHPNELVWLQMLPESQASNLALSLWCLKEAWLKAAQAVDSVKMSEILFDETLCLVSAKACLETEWSSSVGEVGGAQGSRLVLALCVKETGASDDV
jgi:phosphopantetheinyl transferase